MSQMKMPLGPFVFRLRFESFIKALFLALAGGMIGAFTTMFVLYIFKVPTIWIAIAAIVIASLIALMVGVIAYFVLYRLSHRDIIRRIDEAGLQERITTMEELRDDDSYIAKIQREDTMRRVKALKPRAIPIFLPMVAGIVLLSVSMPAVAFALMPQVPTSTKADDAIPDDYEIIIPAINELPGYLYEAVESLPETIPGTLRDELNGIIKDIEDLNEAIKDGTETGDMDNVADLEDVIDRLDQILEENVKAPLISDYMMNYPILKPLANALKSARETDVHNALYNLYYGYDEQLATIIVAVSKSQASPHIKSMLNLKITSLMDAVKNTTNSFGEDRRQIIVTTEAIQAEGMTAIVMDGSIEKLLSEDPLFADLGAALIAGDEEAVTEALNALRDTLVDGENVKKTELDSVVNALHAVMETTIDRPDGTGTEDAAWTAIQNLHGKLENVQVLISGVGNEDYTRLVAAFTSANAEFGEAVIVNRQDAAAFDMVIRELEYITSGRYLYAYLWNDPEHEAYIPEKGEGLAGVLRRVLDDDCGFSEYYKESPLINAMYALLEDFENSAMNALRDGGAYDPMFDLYGSTRPGAEEPAEHKTHTEKNPMPIACNDIIAALIVEEEISDVVEDMKDQIQDAIEDLLPEEEEDEEPDTGIDSKPPEPPPSGQPGDPDDSENNDDNPPDQEQPPSGGGPQGGKEDTSGLTFFNPETKQEEPLNVETLNKFKEELDKAIDSGIYSDEEATQMNRYYEYLLQKFSGSN